MLSNTGSNGSLVAFHMGCERPAVPTFPVDRDIDVQTTESAMRAKM